MNRLGILSAAISALSTGGFSTGGIPLTRSDMHSIDDTRPTGPRPFKNLYKNNKGQGKKSSYWSLNCKPNAYRSDNVGRTTGAFIADTGWTPKPSNPDGPQFRRANMRRNLRRAGLL
jgi:hypothetical protein